MENKMYENQNDKDRIISSIVTYLNGLYNSMKIDGMNKERVIEVFLFKTDYSNIELYAKAIHSFAINTLLESDRLVIFFCSKKEEVNFSIISLFLEYSNIFFQRTNKKCYFSIGTLINHQKEICFSAFGGDKEAIYNSAREYSYSNFDSATKLLQIIETYKSSKKNNQINVKSKEQKIEMPVELYVKYNNTNIDKQPVDNVLLDIYNMPNNNFKDSIFMHKINELLNTPLNHYDVLKGNGCKISNVHVRLGAKIHIENFYEAEILFHNANNVKNFAYIIAKDISLQHQSLKEEKNICLIGYESYSELLVKQIKDYLEQFIKVNEIKTLFYYNDESKKIKNKISKEFITYIIVPIGSTLSTFYKMLSDSQFINNNISLANYHYVLTLVRDETALTATPIESKFWDFERENILKLKNAYRSKLNNIRIKYLLAVSSKWKQAENCELCYPLKKSIDERAIFHVDKTSTLPKLVFDLFNSNRKGFNEGFFKNDKLSITKNSFRLQKLKECIRYGHIENENNHFIYYIDTKKVVENACKDDFDSLNNWIKKLKSKFQEQYDFQNRFNILVSPLNNTNGEFLNIIINQLFGTCYRFFHFSIKDSLREDVRAKFKRIAEEFKESEDYAHIHDLIRNDRNKRINCFYLDDIIVSGETFDRAQTLLSMLAKEAGIDNRFDAFDAIITLINRNSYDSVNHLIQYPEKNFFSYVHLNIPTLKREKGKCPNCLLDETYENMMKFVVSDQLREKFRKCYNKQKLMTVTKFDENLKFEWNIKKDKLSLRSIEDYFLYNHLDISNLLIKYLDDLKEKKYEEHIIKCLEELIDYLNVGYSNLLFINKLFDLTTLLKILYKNDSSNHKFNGWVEKILDDIEELIKQEKINSQNQKAFIRLKCMHLINSEFDAYFQTKKFNEKSDELIGDILKQILILIVNHIEEELTEINKLEYDYEKGLFSFASIKHIKVNALKRYKIIEIILSYLKILSRPMAAKSYYVRNTVLKFSIALLEIIQDVVRFRSNKQIPANSFKKTLKEILNKQISNINLDKNAKENFMFLCEIILCRENDKSVLKEKDLDVTYNCDTDFMQLFIFYFDILENISFLDSTYVIRNETISKLFNPGGLVSWFEDKFESYLKSKKFSLAEIKKYKIGFKSEIKLTYQFIAKWAVTYNEEISRSVLLEKKLELFSSQKENGLKNEILKSLALENTTIIFNSIDSLLNKTILKDNPNDFKIPNEDKGIYDSYFVYIQQKFKENGKAILQYLKYDDDSLQNEFSAFYSYIYKYLPILDQNNNLKELKKFIIALLKYYASIKIALEKHVINDLRDIYGAIATFMMNVSFADAISFSLCDEKRQKEDMILWRVKDNTLFENNEKMELLECILDYEENGISNDDSFENLLYDEENTESYNSINIKNSNIDIIFLKIPIRIKRQNVFEKIEGEQKFILIMLYYYKNSQPHYSKRIQDEVQKMYRAKSVLFVKNRLIDIFSLDYAKISTKEFLQVKPFDIKEKRILHITDIHYQEKDDQKIISGLKSVISSKNKKYDVIVITGDIINGADQANQIDERYTKFFDAFKIILSQVYGDEWDNRVLIVPGNHDYSSMNEGISSNVARNLRVTVPPSILSEANASIKFAYYLNFASYFMKKSLKTRKVLKNDLCFYCDDYEEFGFGFILLNTASLSSSHRQNRVGIKKEILKKLDEFLKEKNKMNGKNLTLIALMHHTPMFDADYLVDKGGGEIGKIISPLAYLYDLTDSLSESKNKNSILNICSEIINNIMNENINSKNNNTVFESSTSKKDIYFSQVKKFSKKICQWAFEIDSKHKVYPYYDKFNLSGFMFLYYLYKKLLEQRDNNISYFSSIEEATKILEMLGINENIIMGMDGYEGNLKDYQEYIKMNHFISESIHFNIEILSEIAKDYWASIYDQNNLNEIKQVLVKNNVKLILGGHNHIYQDNAGKDGIRIIEGAIFYDSKEGEISYNEVKFAKNEEFEIDNKVIKNEEKK